MESDIYNQSEIKFFSDIYKYLKNNVRCDTIGNILAEDIHQFLLNSSRLAEDIIHQIGDVTGGAVQGWYAEKQIFMALKLVAAAQQGIPISSQTPLMEVDLPLPELLTNNNTEYVKKTKGVRLKELKCDSSPNLISLSDSDCPPLKVDKEGYQIIMSEDGEDDYPVEGAESEPTSNFTSHSPSVSSPASDSPTPTNSGHNKHWTQPVNSQWHIIVNEEHHQLLGTEEESSDRHSSEGKDEGKEEEEEDDDGVSEKEVVVAQGDNDGDAEDEKDDDFDHGVNDDDDDDDDDDDVWSMTEEQQQYYTKQFSTMQSDLNGFLPGCVAKQFFEKSKLPVSELRQIWQLADVSRDGALSLEEFFAAMHLVVLRRNKIPLPDKLPKALIPKFFRWTKFVDSPASTLSSPGPKPVNFDFHRSAVEKDPKILHPTPLRVTPESKRLEAEEEDTTCLEKEDDDNTRDSYMLGLKSNCPCYEDAFQDDRSDVSSTVQPNVKVGSATSSTGIIQVVKHIDSNGSQGPRSLPPFSHLASSLPNPSIKDVPPPPPPRPSRSHVRSSSLDLNQFNKMKTHKSPPITLGSPNIFIKKPSESGAPQDARIPDVPEDSPATSNLRNSSTKHNPNSAFEVYKKPLEENLKEARNGHSNHEEEEESQLASFSARQSDKREILSSLQTIREKNSVLFRVNSELNQELAEVTEERIALEFQLEQMKSFSS